KAVRMPTAPRLQGSKTVPGTSGFRSREEEELQRKQGELEDLQSELAELELATLRSELIERLPLRIAANRQRAAFLKIHHHELYSFPNKIGFSPFLGRASPD